MVRKYAISYKLPLAKPYEPVIACHSGLFVLEWKQGKRVKRAAVCCPVIHSGDEECNCSLEETIAYNKWLGYLPKKIKKFKVINF